MEDQALLKAAVKALAYTENGGKLDIDNPQAGKTGEAKSIFQFTPDTWKAYSNETFGKEMPINADNETYVVSQKVSKWMKEGKTLGQIASMWNAGPGKPNAYKEGWKGINKKYGVAYDTPAYADKVINYAKKFYGESQKTSQTSQSSPINEIMSTMKKAQSTTPASQSLPASNQPQNNDNPQSNI